MAARRTVLLLAGLRPQPDALRESAKRLHDAGAGVLLASLRPVETDAADLPLHETHDLTEAAQRRGPGFRRALRAAAPPEAMWLQVREDEWLRDRMPHVCLVMWLDPRAKSAAVRLAEQHPGVRAVGRLHQALQMLDDGATGPAGADGSRSRRSEPRRGRRLPVAAGPLVLAAPGLSETRRARLASAGALDLLRAGREDEADRVVLSALRRIRTSRLRADLLGDRVSWTLGQGAQAALARDAFAAELDVADEHLAVQDHRAAGEAFQEAMRTAFHRSLHFDGLRSPLADDPEGFTAPLRDSLVAQAVRRHQGRSLDRPPAPTSGSDDRPTRLLIATRKNADFLHEIRDHFGNHPDFDTRFVDFLGVPEIERFARNPGLLVEQILTDPETLTPALEEAFRSHLEWADVFFVEWCSAVAALLSRLDPGDTRVVVRMHSFEAFTQWPQLTDFSRVDDMVFVSEHLRDLAVAAVPGLRGPLAPRLHVIANAVDLERCRLPKPDSARFTLGVVGASKPVKDPRWAIEVLRRLRRYDDRYRLLLIRGHLQDGAPGTRAYGEALERDLEDLEPVGAVRRLAHTDDVPGVLQEVGVVVSSSVRESFHLGLVEGAASGAVPVVRDWPFFPGSASRLFPREWVVSDPASAAQRILRLTATDEDWRAAGNAAAEHVTKAWDWTTVRRAFESLFRR
jgi:glycosyltransferase involved in cell wall biosynthesis